MSNVNSDDPGDREAPISQADGDSMGGSYRVDQERQEVTGRGGWTVVGVVIIALVLLSLAVWIAVELFRVVDVAGGDSGIVWLYATVAVLVVGGALWFLYRILTRGGGDR